MQIDILIYMEAMMKCLGKYKHCVLLLLLLGVGVMGYAQRGGAVFGSQGFNMMWVMQLQPSLLWIHGAAVDCGSEAFQTQQQQQPQRRLSPEEFEARKRAYLTQKASLTDGEAERFFPLYNELSRKLNDLRRRVSQQEQALGRGGRKFTEEEYQQALERIYNARIEMARTEKHYYRKYAEFLSYEKIYRILTAEIEFQRDILKRMVR